MVFKKISLRALLKTDKSILLGLFLLATISSTSAFAQGPGNGGPPVFEEETPPPTGVPIDGGATLLLAAGAGYGLKKLRDRQKRNKRNSAK